MLQSQVDRLGAWARLAIRAVVLARRGGATAWVLALGVACMTFIGLAAAAVPQVGANHAEREHAITPLLDFEDSTNGGLRMAEADVTNNRRWNGHEIVRHYYAAGSSSPVAPGVPEMPGAGEYYASPDLTRLMRHDEAVAALFDGWTLLGTIGPEGLAHPHELRAIAGLAGTNSAASTSVSRFGSDEPIGVDAYTDHTILNRVVAAFVAALVVLPALALLVILARLGSAQRQRRARAMRLVGLPRFAVRLFHALETAAIAGPAAAAGTAIFWWTSRYATRIPGTDIGFYPSDVKLDSWVYVLTPVAVAALAAVVTAVSLRFDHVDANSKDPGARQSRVASAVGSWSRATWFGVASLAAGALLLALMPILVATVSPQMSAALWLGSALVAVGLALSGPALVIWLFSRLSRSARLGGRLVGMRMAASHLSTSLRLGSLLGLIIVLLLGGQAFMSILHGGSLSSWSDQLERQPVAPTIVDHADNLTLEQLRQAVPGSAPVQSIGLPRGMGTALFASCADMETLFQIRADTCEPGKPGWVTTSSTPTPADALEFDLPGHGRITAPADAEGISSETLPISLDGALRLPPELAPTALGDQWSSPNYYLLLPTASLTESMARIVSLAPTAQFDLGALQWDDPNTQRFPVQLQWLTIGAVMGLLLGCLALTASVLGEMRERRVRMSALRLLGASTPAFLSAHVWSTAVPLVVLGWTATTCGWLVSRAMHNIDDRAVVPPQAYALCLVGTLVTATVVAAASMPSQRRLR